ncbi:hypothetical protein Hypma_003250 [Hypsizygus marmoreus]|uniref:Uncharacterized protein n=1 Tax=Hypsizygus marmoreus TaxID=39966 RepID=A0A369K272_HYPMA|nr:hypothetical protein Hypma_003250 [Hypsizygus marmoreus]
MTTIITTIIFLPASLLLLLAISLVFASTIFVASLFASTTLSIWLNTITASVAFLHHVAVIVVSWRRSLVVPGPGSPAEKESHPPIPYACTKKSIACLCILFGTWLVALGVDFVAIAQRPRQSQPPSEEFNSSIAIALAALLAVESAIVGQILFHAIKSRRRPALVVAPPVQEKKLRPQTHDWAKALFMPSPLVPTPLTRSGTMASKRGKSTMFLAPPTMPPPRTIRLKAPVPAKFKRGGTKWSYITPGRPSMLEFETPLKTSADYEYRLNT